MREWLVNKIARAIHAAWRDTKKDCGHNGHEVNGFPYNLEHKWHELPKHHQDFDLAIARRLLAGMLNWRGWFG